MDRTPDLTRQRRRTTAGWISQLTCMDGDLRRATYDRSTSARPTVPDPARSSARDLRYATGLLPKRMPPSASAMWAVTCVAQGAVSQ